MITVCIVEDLEDIRNGIAAIINMTDGFKVLQTFANAEDALLQLHVRAFDRVINLDAGKTSAALASAANAARKDGFVLDPEGPPVKSIHALIPVYER